MEFLEMPYEPVSFRFDSLVASSAGGSLLTCLAVLAAAAVGFWRMRTNGPRTDTASILTSSSSEDEALKKAVPEPVQVHEEAVRSMDYEAVSPTCSEGLNTPKIRFMAYFDTEDSYSIGCCHLDDEEEEQTDDYCSCEESDYTEKNNLRYVKEKEEVNYWEEMASKKRDLGWYSFQDMAVVNGNVVRLWDGDSISSPRKRNTARHVISSF